MISIFNKYKKDTIETFKIHETDTGSADVQIALLTEKIKHLTSHLKTNKKDKQTVYSLIKMSSRRNKLMKYLENSKGMDYLLKVKGKIGLK